MLMSVPGLSAEIAQCRITERKVTNKEKRENPPTNISSMVRFITKYVARVRRLRFHCYYSNRHGNEYSEPGDAPG